MTGEIIDPASLYGVWSLTAATAVAADGSSLAAPYGPDPRGAIILTKNGRMMSVVCDGRPALPESETRGYSSYCGNFSFDGSQLTTIVDAAAITARIGSRQVRDVEMRDGQLVLRPPARPDGEQRELVWKFSGPA